MSFRIKTTHPLLDTRPPPTVPSENEKTNKFLVDTLKLDVNVNNNQRLPAARRDSNAGLFIRTIPFAQADHM